MGFVLNCCCHKQIIDLRRKYWPPIQCQVRMEALAASYCEPVDLWFNGCLRTGFNRLSSRVPAPRAHVSECSHGTGGRSPSMSPSREAVAHGPPCGGCPATAAWGCDR